MTGSSPRSLAIRTHEADSLPRHLGRWEAFCDRRGPIPLSYHPIWPAVLARGLGHSPLWLEAADGDETRGLLPLALVRSRLFGRFLVGLPYLNYGGVMADDEAAGTSLIEGAITLADRLDVRYLELRHEQPIEHFDLVTREDYRVHMRLTLPDSAEDLWKRVGSGVRNQIRKGRKSGLSAHWGDEDLLDAFHDVFSRNMRDLGTPTFGRAIFRSILRAFPGRAELCVVRLGPRPVAAALLLHGRGVTEVPSAGSLREYNWSCANMMMYFELLGRAVDRGQGTFDFGRSAPGGPTFRFKKQWGARPHPACWQYHVRGGRIGEANRDDPRFRRLVELWRRLPVGMTRLLGPPIVRGIP